MAGRPPGSKNKDKPWTEALRLEVAAAEADTSQRSLRKIARKVLELAASGDMQAIREIGDRLDGKPAQESTVTVKSELDSMNDAELRDFIRRELEESSGSRSAAPKQSDPRVTH